MTAGRRAVLTLAVALLCVAGTAGSDSSPNRPVAVAVGAALVVGGTSRGAARSPAPVSRMGLWWWGGVLSLVVAFQVANFVQSPRSTYPTLSALINVAFEAHAARAAGFALWLGAGWYVLRR